MNMKRLLISSVLFATALFSATGCKKQTVIPDLTNIEQGYNGEDVTLTFYHSMGQTLQDVLSYYIDEFNEVYPNIHINATSIGGYDDIKDQLTKEISIGSNADIAYCYPDHVANYNKAKKVVSLDALINDKEFGLGLTEAQINDFIPAYYEEGKQFGDGKMYCLPFSKSTEVMYYDKTFFDEHNLSVPTTWEELETVARQIKAIDSKCIPLGYDSSSNLFITLLEQYGAEYTSVAKPHFRFDNETSRTFLGKLKSWYQDGLFTTKSLYGTYTSSLFINTPSPDNPVRCYMCIGSSAGASYQCPDPVNGRDPFEVGIAPIPQVNASHKAVISQGPSVCIFRNTDPIRVIASWLFIKYLLTNIDFQASFSMTSGYAPVIQSVYENDIYSNWLENTNGNRNIQALSVKTSLEQKNSYFSSPVFVGSAEARNAVGELLAAVVGGVKTMDQAFSDAIDELDYISD